MSRMNTRHRRVALANVVMCGCLLFGVRSAIAQTLPGTHEWGFIAGPESQKLLNQARESRRGLVPTFLVPDPETDVVLPEVSLAAGANGHRIVVVRGQLDSDSKDMFWMVNPQTGTYRIFILRNPAADARRIHQFLKDRMPSAQVPLDGIQGQLEEALSRKAARQAARASSRLRAAASSFTPKLAILKGEESTPAAPSAALALALWDQRGKPRVSKVAQYPVCVGGGEAAIGHFDPVFIKLTDTYTWADWWYNGFGSFSVRAGGSCWANPETSAGTHWFQDACPGELRSNVSFAFAHTENLSHNSDFGDPDLLTWVDDQADVYQTNGSPAWATFSDDWGEYSWLIFGVTLLGWARC